jgi:hypothetical protein
MKKKKPAKIHNLLLFTPKRPNIRNKNKKISKETTQNKTTEKPELLIEKAKQQYNFLIVHRIKQTNSRLMECFSSRSHQQPSAASSSYLAETKLE